MFNKRIPAWVITLGVLFSCFATCGATIWFVDLRPQYLELAYPQMNGMLNWSYTQWTTHQWNYTTGHHYLWRREILCNLSCGDSAAIADHFDDWLISQGWARIDNRYGAFCNPSYFPESAFLDVGVENGYRAYATEDTDFAADTGAIVCVAVWEEGSTGYHNIILLTINPSLLTQWGDEYDYM